MSDEATRRSELLEQYRTCEQWSHRRAEAARSEGARKSYLEIARGWASLAAQLEESLGSRASRFDGRARELARDAVSLRRTG